VEAAGHPLLAATRYHERMGRYVVLDDVAIADCAVDLEGCNLPDLFATAARALAELMVDPPTLCSSSRERVRLEAKALDLLLFDWLSELIFRKDRDREVFPHATVEIGGQGPFALTADLVGGRIDPAHTALRADPKAVTFHQFALEAVDDRWRARVVIDL
jgi:SHS2 domain-containing protein